jgi:hypothetical protein
MLDAPRLALVLFTLMVGSAAIGPTVGAGHFGATAVAAVWFVLTRPTGPLGVRNTVRYWPLPPLALALACTDAQSLTGLHPLVVALGVLVLGGAVGLATTRPTGRIHRAMWPVDPNLMHDFQRHTAQLMRAARLEPFDLVVEVCIDRHHVNVRPVHHDTKPTLERTRAVCKPAEDWLANALEKGSLDVKDRFMLQGIWGTGDGVVFSFLIPHVPENAHAVLQRLAQTDNR